LLEQKRKEREEQHLYLNACLVTDDNFKAHQGFDLSPWEAEPGNPAAPKVYRILRTTTVGDFSRTVAEEHGEEPERIRLWVMVNRQNKTIRPDQPLMDPEMTVEEAHNKFGTRHLAFRLWVEVAETMEDGKAVWPDMQPQTNNNALILVFVKHFDPESQTLKGAGHLYIRRHSKVSDLISLIQKLMGWSQGTQVSLYEVSILSSTVDKSDRKAGD
jgi:ubiquitin carboxyl-terminal hydrolase 7